MSIAKRKNPKLWEKSKEKAIKKMGGKFSARAMQYAVKLYKEAGGKYIGPKRADNDLRKWTKEDWGYVGEKNKSRYLPKGARQNLTRGEKAATSRAKNEGTREGEQWVRQPKSIAKKTSKYRK